MSIVEYRPTHPHSLDERIGDLSLVEFPGRPPEVHMTRSMPRRRHRTGSGQRRSMNACICFFNAGLQAAARARLARVQEVEAPFSPASAIKARLQRILAMP